ncbi:MAG: HAMP domain-containing histidine kinase [Desulfarculus sp.]|nr:HAMP domain-containing histidine kinase [Desulfarculus sp.]
MPHSDTTETHFAPAARAGLPEVGRQARAVSQAPQLGRLLDQVPNLLLVLNRHRQAVYSNQSLLDLLGLDSEGPLLGQRPGEIMNCVHCREMPGGCGTSESCRHCGAALAILAGLDGQRAVRECRLTVRRPEGLQESMDLQVWATPLTLEDEPYTFVAISDLSDQKRRRALERLFFHDILNTAGGLMGLTALLKEPGQADLPALAESMRLAAEQLVQEIQAQRDLAAAENNELRVWPTQFSAGDILGQYAQVMERHPVAQERSLSLKAPALDQELVSDPALLGRVLVNLLKNALEACQPGQEVSTGFLARQGGVEFWVHNPAVMPREVQLQVFKRSFSTKGPGRGLGTYSVKLLTERYLKGRVWFTSSPGEGTTFRVWLPLELPE